MTNDDYAHNVTARGSTVVFELLMMDNMQQQKWEYIYLIHLVGLTDATYAIAALHGELA